MILHPNDPGERVTPQLRETALWLARMDTDVLELLFERDPSLLVQTDLELSDEQRLRLVGKLLTLVETEQLSPGTIEDTNSYRRLAHPSISELLSPYIRDTTRHVGARRRTSDGDGDSSCF